MNDTNDQKIYLKTFDVYRIPVNVIHEVEGLDSAK